MLNTLDAFKKENWKLSTTSVLVLKHSMSALDWMTAYPFMSSMLQSYSCNTGMVPTTLFQFPLHSQPIPFPGFSTVPFINSCDLSSHLKTLGAYSCVGSDLDSNNKDKAPDDSILTIRIVMLSKEVGSIIGRRGDNVRRFREESMARINISDGNSPERIVTISGTCNQIYYAVVLMCRVLQEDTIKISDKFPDSNASDMSLRLLITQGLYHGITNNYGEKMAQLKEMSGVTFVFGNEFLPNSSERLLTISGSSESIAIFILRLCEIFNEVSPVLCENVPVPTLNTPLIPMHNMCQPYFYSDPMSYPFGLPISLVPLKFPTPTSPYLQKSGFDPIWKPAPNSEPKLQQNVKREFFVENEVVGCIIGRGGSTINEIRALSGAQIKISSCEDGKQERKINICGTFESVQTAQLLIHSRITWECLRWQF